jgi:hypothetical protein
LFQCIREVYSGKYFIPPSVATKLAGRQSVEDLTPANWKCSGCWRKANRTNSSPRLCPSPK